MALSKSALSDLLDALRAGGDLDVIREALALVLQALIEAEAAQQIGAGRYERIEPAAPPTATAPAARLLSTKAGDVELRIPKLREGSFFPALLEPRRRIDRALLAVVMEAYVHGTSTRKVDDLVKALGVDAGISKSEVSRICGELDGEVAAFRSRSLAHTAFPYVFVDATYLKARVDGRVVSPGGGDRHRGDRRRRPRGARPGRRRQRGRRVLDRVPALAQGPRAGRGAAGHLRRPHRAQGRHRRGHGRRLLAALPGPFPAQRARPGAQGLGRDGGRGHPHHLRPAHRRRGHRPGRQGRGHAGRPSSRPWRRCWPTPART